MIFSFNINASVIYRSILSNPVFKILIISNNAIGFFNFRYHPHGSTVIYFINGCVRRVFHRHIKISYTAI